MSPKIKDKQDEPTFYLGEMDSVLPPKRKPIAVFRAMITEVFRIFLRKETLPELYGQEDITICYRYNLRVPEDFINSVTDQAHCERTP